MKQNNMNFTKNQFFIYQGSGSGPLSRIRRKVGRIRNTAGDHLIQNCKKEKSFYDVTKRKYFAFCEMKIVPNLFENSFSHLIKRLV